MASSSSAARRACAPRLRRGGEDGEAITPRSWTRSPASPSTRERSRRTVRGLGLVSTSDFRARLRRLTFRLVSSGDSSVGGGRRRRIRARPRRRTRRALVWRARRSLARRSRRGGGFARAERECRLARGGGGVFRREARSRTPRGVRRRRRGEGEDGTRPRRGPRPRRRPRRSRFASPPPSCAAREETRTRSPRTTTRCPSTPTRSSRL